MCCAAAENLVEQEVAPGRVDMAGVAGMFSLDKAQATGAV